MERAWNGSSPKAGSISSVMIFSGVEAATSSISVPPSVEAITMLCDVERSSSTDR